MKTNLSHFSKDLLMTSNRGWLNWRYNQVRSRIRRMKHHEANQVSDEPNVEEESTDREEYIQEMKEAIAEMKRLPVSVPNLAKLRELLNKTRKHRMEILKPNADGMRDVDIKEYFPYFLTHPETMVIFVATCFYHLIELNSIQ